MKSVGKDKNNSFTADELCRIIDSCASRGVQSFSLGGLELTFGAEPQFIQPELREVRRGKKLSLAPEPDHEQNEKDAVEQDELRTKEEQVAMLILEDPQEFERQLADGELEEMLDDASSDESA